MACLSTFLYGFLRPQQDVKRTPLSCLTVVRCANGRDMANKNLSKAKDVKNDEFYTQYDDIQKEVNAYLEYDADVFRGKTILLPCDDPEKSNFTKFFAQNFERFGLEKLVSTSYAPEAKAKKYGGDMSLYSYAQEHGEAAPENERGRIYVLERGAKRKGRLDIGALNWEYLKGDGDFRSEEVSALRDEADFIVTNPPFSLFREFMSWVTVGKKSFLVIGNMNAVTYKEVFPLIKANKMWLGATGSGSDMVFGVPSGAKVDPKDREKAAKLGYVGDYTRLGNSCWYSNIEHGRRHQPLRLMTKAENIKHSKHKEIKEVGYRSYDNYDAIEVPFVDAIPSDFSGVIGVPKSFLDKYCPEQFEIVGCAEGDSGKELGLKPFDRKLKKLNPSLRDGQLYYFEDGVPVKPFARILIRHKKAKAK